MGQAPGPLAAKAQSPNPWTSGEFPRLPLNDKISFKNPRRLPCLRVHTAEVGTWSLSPDHRRSD